MVNVDELSSRLQDGARSRHERQTQKSVTVTKRARDAFPVTIRRVAHRLSRDHLCLFLLLLTGLLFLPPETLNDSLQQLYLRFPACAPSLRAM